jgi:hypothetical protein
MATEKEVLDEQNFVTDRISTQVRAIALSMIAVSWLFLSGGANLASITTAKLTATTLSCCILLSFVALVFDYLQYAAGYISTRATHSKGPDADGQFKYDYDAWHHKTRGIMFIGKQIVLIVGIVVFVVAVMRPLL